MKKITFIIFLFLSQTFQVLSNEPKLQKITNGLDSPWSLSFINDSKVLITEKSGNLILIDLNNQKIKKIKHNLNILEDGQGGLLEVLYFNEQVFVSYSENLKNGNCHLKVTILSNNNGKNISLDMISREKKFELDDNLLNLLSSNPEIDYIVNK